MNEENKTNPYTVIKLDSSDEMIGMLKINGDKCNINGRNNTPQYRRVALRCVTAQEITHRLANRTRGREHYTI